MGSANFKELERLFKSVANKRRLQILAFLKREKEATVGTIAEYIKLSFKSTSRHLSVLLSAGVVDKEQRGLEAHYFISARQHVVTDKVISIV